MGGLGGHQVGGAQPEPPHEEGLRPGQWPPRFAAEDLSGNRQTLEQYEGKILVLHFWASWCPFCRGEIPKLTTLHEQWVSKGVAVLTVSLDEDRAQLEQFVQQATLPYPVVADSQAPTSLGRRYDVSGIPVTYILGRDGRIIFRFEGRADIIGAAQTALEQHPPSQI